jgi:hypothetical protein
MNARTSLTLHVTSTALLLLAGSQFLYALPPAVVDLRVVAVSGKTAPGTGGQIFAPTLGIGGLINNQGQVLFGADTQTTNGVRPGMWFESSPGQVSLVLWNNNPAPGLGAGKTYDYQGGGVARVNQSGNIAYAYGYKPFPVDNTGVHVYGIGEAIWSTAGGSGLHVVAADGLPYPTNSGGPNLSYVDSSLDFNDAGQISFNSFDGTNSHVWVDTPGQAPREVVNTLGAVPGVPGAKFDYFGPPLLNSSGKVTFAGVLKSGFGGVTDNTLSGLWQENAAGTLQLVARGGQIAPESGGLAFDRYPVLSGPIGFNSAGQISFISMLSDFSRIIYAQDASLQLHKMARSGEAAFGVPGATFKNLFEPAINNLGQIAFAAADSQLGKEPYYPTGIWSNVGGTFHPVMRLGQTLPDTPAGTAASYVNGMILNNSGQVLFGADFGVPLGNGDYSYLGSGIWAQDANGVIRTILRNGDVVDVDPSAAQDLRIVSFIEVGFYDANRRGIDKFNEHGQILLSLDFTDGSHGLFISNLMAVPEPVGVAYLSALAIAIGASRVRRARKL